MADIDDQNTPKDDFSQSIDGDSAGLSPEPAGDGQRSDMTEEMSASKPASAAGAGKRANTRASEPAWDESTLTGRLEKKLSSVTDVLWEKEGLQMQYTIKKNIREEYYRRWKGEGNAFLILAARIRRRLEKERARNGNVAKGA